MPNLARTLGAVALAVALLVAVPADAHAQAQETKYPISSSVQAAVWAGYELPSLDLADAADPGPVFGVSVGPRIAEQVHLSLRGDLALLSGKTFTTRTGSPIEGPDVTRARVAGDLMVNLFDPRLTKWKLLVNGGIGLSFLSSDSFTARSFRTGETVSSDGLSETNFTTHAGVKIAYPVSPTVDLWAGAEGIYTAVDEESSTVQEFQNLDPRRLVPFNNYWTVPLVGGVRVHLN